MDFATRSKQHMPEDVLLQILCKLPVKSIVKFSCVSKSWYALLRNPIFIKLHTHHFSSVDNDCYLLCNYRPLTNRTEFSLLSQATRKHTPLTISLSGAYEALFSYNGLVCLTVVANFGNSFMLLNPVLGEIKAVPEFLLPGSISDQIFYYLGTCVGFYFDKENNDYKIVRICQFLEFENMFTNIDEYSFRNDSWKRFNVDTDIAMLHNDSTTIIYKNSMFFITMDFKIASFDLVNKTFSTMIIPGGLEKGVDFALWEDHLAVICFYNKNTNPDLSNIHVEDFQLLNDYVINNLNYDLDGDLGYGLNGDEDQDHDQIDIWILKEDNSWVRKFSWEHDLGRIVLSRRKNNGDFLTLAMDTGTYYLYDEATGTLEIVDPPDHPSLGCTIVGYKESLISVNRG